MWFIYVIFAPVVFMILVFLIHYVITAIKMKRFTPPSPTGKPEKKSILKRILIDFPQAYWRDRFTADPDEFHEYGLHMVCGEQGSGKTVTVAYLFRKLKKKYPKSKAATNFCYKYEDKPISDWRDLLMLKNGIYGYVIAIDEIQNWFSTNDSKDFPAEMLTEITQQRKQKKMIIGTAQVFTRVAKPIREQAMYIYQPFTIMGCLTIVRVSKPDMDHEGQVKKLRFNKLFFFVHDSELRDSFDTYKKIERIATKGFKPRTMVDSPAS
jgi:hypothetical protein